MRHTITFFFVLIVVNIGFCQSKNPLQGSADSLSVTVNTKVLIQMQVRYNALSNAIQCKTQKLLNAMQRQETKLRAAVTKQDTIKAQQLFWSAANNYQELQNRINSPAGNNIEANTLREYIPNLDSIENALNFLQQKQANLPPDKLQKIQEVSSQFKNLEIRIQQANEVQIFVAARQQQLKDQLGKFNVGKKLLGTDKQFFYYQQQILQYKAVLADKDRLQSTLLGDVNQLPAFKTFMQKNSYLAKLLPANQNTGKPEGLAGLQTITDIKKQLQERFGKDALTPTSSGSGSPLQQQVQSAQSGLSKLKDKINALGNNSSDIVIPGSNVNLQKNKSFLKRLTYGVNLQSLPGTTFLPATSDLGLSIGYKLSDKAITGGGASYAMGWGNGFNHIHISSQGMGLRSFLDIKAKGSVWVTGAWEYNYYQAFSKISDLHTNINVWQKSALAGLTKKYKIGKQDGNMQLLYNLLAGQQTPRVPALKFRIGYIF